MSTLESMPSRLLVELQDAANKAAAGIRDRAAMQRACQRMDAMREENRKRIGTQNIAVDLIRDARR